MGKEIVESLRQKVRETIGSHNLISKGEHIVIGLSGGPDSVCLFDVLYSLQDELGISIFPVHINHGLRGTSSDDDQRYCEKLCKSRGLECRVFSFDCAEEARRKKITCEEAGREFRYNSFEETAKKVGASKIAVAHNADDRAETVLLRMIRGTGTDGLAGIRHKRILTEKVEVIRPILDIARSDIEEYCTEVGIDPRHDDTNDEPLFSRNRVRLELIPLLEGAYNPKIKEALNRIATAAAEDSDYLKKEAKEALEQIALQRSAEYLLLDGSRLRRYELPIRRRIVSMAFYAAGLTEDITSSHFDSCEEIIFSGQPSQMTHLPHGYILENVYDDIGIGRRTENVLCRDMKIKVSTCPKKAFDDMSFEDLHAFFDFDKLYEMLGSDPEKLIKLRSREPGDVIRTKAGTKKIQNLFVDMKVPKGMRDEALLVAAGKEVLVVIMPENEGKRRTRFSSAAPLDVYTKKVLNIEFGV